MHKSFSYFKGAAVAVLLAAGTGAGAELFSDDFTNAAASHNKWINLDPNTLNTSVNGGSCTLDNGASQYVGEYRHYFDANSKPATFTLSYTLKSVQGNNIAGALFCGQPNSRNGYILTAKGGFVTVYKITTGNNVEANSVLHKESPYLNSDNNELTVSKSGSTFHVSANGFLVGTFTDATYNSGDISLITFHQVKAVFGAVRVTDDFTEGGTITYFHDEFDDGTLHRYWKTLSTVNNPSVNEANGVLTVTTPTADAAVWMYVGFEHQNFTAEIETNHVSGSESSTYGLVIIGDGTTPDGNTPMAYFSINDNRQFSIWTTASSSYYLEPNAAINGTGQTDRLEIKKTSGSSEYVFSANGTRLGGLNAADLGFSKIAGVGIYCYDGLSVAFDNFKVLKEGSSTSVKPGTGQVSRAPSSVINRNSAFYDLRGRKRYSAITPAGRAQTRAAGIYVSKNGRDVVVRKARTARE
jgi:hypothetical protein